VRWPGTSDEICANIWQIRKFAFQNALNASDPFRLPGKRFAHSERADQSKTAHAIAGAIARICKGNGLSIFGTLRTGER
jgi:hypothetical protein